MRIERLDRGAARLQAAGWKQTFRIVRAGPNTTDDGIRWRDPADDSIFLTEAEALERLTEREAAAEDEGAG